MLSIWETPFIVVDLETTGSNPAKNRIIELAAVTLIGGEIVSKFNSLINPHQFIPSFIAKMTGISNNMVYKACEELEVLPKFQQILSIPDAVFVAHNASFDWGFIRSTFERLSLEMPPVQRLCTLKLSRRILIKNLKKNVGSLSEYFDINLFNRHRAFGDAAATALILKELLELAEKDHNISNKDELLAFQNKPIRNFRVPTRTYKRLEDKFDDLPESPGVYYYKDQAGNILYIGKAKSLKKRIRSYFSPEPITSRKISNMLKKTHDLSWTMTATELSAILLESSEIKLHRPPFNTVDKVYREYPFIRITTNEMFPIIEITHTIEPDGAEYYGPFRSMYLVNGIIETISKQFKLRKCDKPVAENSDRKPCFYFHIKKCNSPCSGGIDAIEYAKELDKVRYFLSGFSNGIINQLQRKMEDFAETLEFERAQQLKTQINELRKLFQRDKNIPTSVNKNSVVMVLPAISELPAVEIFLVRSGKLMHSETFLCKDDIDPLSLTIHDIYFNGHTDNNSYTKEDINNLKLLSGWTYRNKETGDYLYVDGKTENELLSELEEAIRK
jgi:DNA polymerase III subunit epsilon